MKKRMISLLLVFVLMLVCFGILSRAVSSFSIANVKVTSATSQIITHEIRVDGEVSHISEQAILTESNQIVSSVFVTEGQVVALGDPLMSVDLDTLQRQIDAKDAEIRKIDLNIKSASVAEQDTVSVDSASTIDTLRVDRQLAQEDFDRLVVLRDKDGIVDAPFDGTVTMIISDAGSTTGSGAILLMSNDLSGYKIEAQLPIGGNEFILGEDLTATVNLNSGKRISELSIATRLSEDGSKIMLSATLPPEEENYTDGSLGGVSIELSSAEYNKCFPVESVHTEGSNLFVYAVTEVSGFTGSELTVRKIYVNMLDSDGRYIAVDDSSISREEQVVAQSDRVLDESSRIRITE